MDEKVTFSLNKNILSKVDQLIDGKKIKNRDEAL
jgi:metal-responsive CopG/Arc/MetJ family transcriptional regulator